MNENFWKFIAAVAAIITIFSFVTGIVNINQIYDFRNLDKANKQQTQSKTIPGESSKKKSSEHTKTIPSEKSNIPHSEVIDDKISITNFRKYSAELSKDDVKIMLKKYDFCCKDEYWNKDYCNTNGNGFKNSFVKQKNDQVVYDRNSGLMWQKSGSKEYMNFDDAKKYINKLNTEGLAGHSDWRLPTLEEAMSLMEPVTKNELYIDPLFDDMQGWIWTCDPIKDEGSEQLRWIVNFCLARCDVNFFIINSNSYVRAVRSSQ